MIPHRTYGNLDEAPNVDGDRQFLGANARTDPSQLDAGWCSDAVNMRFDRGLAETRLGYPIMRWAGKAEAGSDPDIVLPYGPVLRAEAYRDPTTAEEWLVIVRDGDGDIPLGATYACRPGRTGFRISEPEDTDWTTVTDLIQTYNGLVALRGATLEPLYLRTVEEGWRPMTTPAAGKEKIPVSTVGLYFANRLFVVDARDGEVYRDSVWVSDIGGVDSVLQGAAAGVAQSFKINQGGSDDLVGLAKFNETTVVALKRQSVYVVTGVYGDNSALAANARLDRVTDEYGCSAPRTAVQVGSDLWFLAHRRGVSSIAQTTTNALQGVDVPVSRDIQTIIDRINWSHAHLAVAAAHNSRVYFAVPIDGASENNAILVYSTITGSWAGYDQSDATAVRDWVKFTFQGEVRLGYVSVDGFVHLVEYGYEDETGDEEGNLTRVEIPWSVTTRAYHGKASGEHRFGGIEMRVRTFDAAFSVSAVPPGQAEADVVKSVDVSRIRYRRPHGAADWDPANGNEDWANPHREDYSWTAYGSDGAGVVVDDADGNGVIGLDVHQDQVILRRINQRGPGLMLKVVGTRGRAELQTITVGARRGRRRLPGVIT